MPSQDHWHCPGSAIFFNFLLSITVDCVKLSGVFAMGGRIIIEKNRDFPVSSASVNVVTATAVQVYAGDPP